MMYIAYVRVGHPLVWVMAALVCALQITYNVGGNRQPKATRVFQDQLKNVPKMSVSWNEWASDKITRLHLPLDELNWYRNLLDLPSDKFHEVLQTRIRSYYTPDSLEYKDLHFKNEIEDYQKKFEKFAAEHKEAERFNDEMRDLFLESRRKDLDQHGYNRFEDEDTFEDADKHDENQTDKIHKTQQKLWGGRRAGTSVWNKPEVLTPDLMCIVCAISAYLWIIPSLLVQSYLELTSQIQRLHERMPVFSKQTNLREGGDEKEEVDDVLEEEYNEYEEDEQMEDAAPVQEGAEEEQSQIDEEAVIEDEVGDGQQEVPLEEENVQDIEGQQQDDEFDYDFGF
eukprot:TRINITY_DN9736_c0_g3_i2.p1 TRINITY_DN9736_c0_g3~~TRINITY_DN9736_c0_g3_i2.p1  ORF type:complete len:340 (-),score=63.95 TRINITY_DN9736_c0_g3_i2:156-1175(-)